MATASSPYPRLEWLGWRVVLGLAALVAPLLARNLLTSWWHAVTGGRFGASYTGGLLAVLIERPELWYQPLQQGPKMPTLYPPGWLTLGWVIQTATGLPAPLTNRLIGLSAVIGTAIGLALCVWEWTGRRDAAVLTGALWLLFPSVHQAVVLARVDHLAMLLGVWALYAALRDWRALAGALVIASLYSKHSVLALPMAVFVIIGSRAGWRPAAQWAVTVVILGLSGLAALVIATNGAAWRQLVIINAAQGWSLADWAGLLVSFAWWTFPTLAVLAGRTRDLRGAPSAAIVLAIVGGLQFVVSAGKTGAWIGYAYPGWAGATLLSGWLLGCHTTPRWFRERSLARIVIIALVVTQAAVWTANQPSPVFETDKQRQLASDVNGDRILTEDASLLTATESSEAYDPLATKYANVDIDERIARQRYDVIILLSAPTHHSTRWSASEIQALKQRYCFKKRISQYGIYRPKPCRSTR